MRTALEDSVLLKTCLMVFVVDKYTDDESQCLTSGGRRFVPDDDDDHEEVIKTFPICRAR
jgi:hypothetical protein